MFSRVFQNESDIDELRLVYILFRNIRRDFRAGGDFLYFFFTRVIYLFYQRHWLTMPNISKMIKIGKNRFSEIPWLNNKNNGKIYYNVMISFFMACMNSD